MHYYTTGKLDKQTMGQTPLGNIPVSRKKKGEYKWSYKVRQSGVSSGSLSNNLITHCGSPWLLRALQLLHGLGPLQCLLIREQTSLFTKHCRSEPQISSNINQTLAGWALMKPILHESLWLPVSLCGLQFVPKHSQSFTSLSYAFIHTEKQVPCDPRGTSFSLPPSLGQKETNNCSMLSKVQALCEKGRKHPTRRLMGSHFHTTGRMSVGTAPSAPRGTAAVGRCWQHSPESGPTWLQGTPFVSNLKDYPECNKFCSSGKELSYQ